MQIINVIGYEGLYAVTDDGRFFSLKTGKEIKTKLSNGGYLYANLHKNNVASTVYVHKAVYYSFHNYGYLKRKQGDELVIDHIDGNKTNNRLDNLRRTTTRENTSRAKSNKSGFKGVHYFKHLNKYGSEIIINGTRYYLGLSESAEEAATRYKCALDAYEKHGILPKKIDHTIKTCKRCNKTLHIEDFYLIKGHGRSYYCKQCCREYSKEQREKTKSQKVSNDVR